MEPRAPGGDLGGGGGDRPIGNGQPGDGCRRNGLAAGDQANVVPSLCQPSMHGAPESSRSDNVDSEQIIGSQAVLLWAAQPDRCAAVTVRCQHGDGAVDIVVCAR